MYAGNVPGLGLDDRQRGERPTSQIVVQLDGPLQQPGMKVEHVAGIGLATRRPAQQQRHLPVGIGVLCQVVVDHQRGLTVVEEVLAHRAAGVRGEELDRRRLVGRRHDDDRVVHRPRLLERFGQRHHRRLALSDRYVHADQVAVLVVDDRVDPNRRLAGLAVADDQLALATADGDHRVDRLQPGQHRLLDRLALNDSRSLVLGGPRL